VCTWDKPKKTSEPMEIDNINLQRDTTKEKKITPTTKNYSPCGQINSRVVEKDVYSLFKSSNSLLLHLLDPPSDDNSSEDEIDVPTLKNAMLAMPKKQFCFGAFKKYFHPRCCSTNRKRNKRSI
jgi:hypothetical protein